MEHGPPTVSEGGFRDQAPKVVHRDAAALLGAEESVRIVTDLEQPPSSDGVLLHSRTRLPEGIAAANGVNDGPHAGTRIG